MCVYRIYFKKRDGEETCAAGSCTCPVTFDTVQEAGKQTEEEIYSLCSNICFHSEYDTVTGDSVALNQKERERERERERDCICYVNGQLHMSLALVLSLPIMHYCGPGHECLLFL